MIDITLEETLTELTSEVRVDIYPGNVTLVVTDHLPDYFLDGITMIREYTVRSQVLGRPRIDE